LNQNLSSNFFRTVYFASRFILSIKSKFKIHTFNSYYESRCKINGSQRLWTQILVQRVLNLSHLLQDMFWRREKWKEGRESKNFNIILLNFYYLNCGVSVRIFIWPWSSSKLLIINYVTLIHVVDLLERHNPVDHQTPLASSDLPLIRWKDWEDQHIQFLLFWNWERWISVGKRKGGKKWRNENGFENQQYPYI
jgi:hypothetical protein